MDILRWLLYSFLIALVIMLAAGVILDVLIRKEAKEGNTAGLNISNSPPLTSRDNFIVIAMMVGAFVVFWTAVFAGKFIILFTVKVSMWQYQCFTG